MSEPIIIGVDHGYDKDTYEANKKKKKSREMER